MTGNRERFANRLRRLRHDRGYSAARHFAQTLGIPENRYTRYERGDSEPDLDDLYLFFEHLPASPNELFGVEGGKPAFHSSPGFEAGPQESLQSGRDPGHAPDQPPLARPSRRTEADAAAWALATLVIRNRRQESSARIAHDHLTLAELRETGLLFKALCSDPYGTVAQLVTTSLQPIAGPASAVVEQAIERYMKCLV